MFSVDYRLAPRHRFPSAADDVRSGWDWLTHDLGVDPEKTIVAGDSAGGHLSVDLLLQPDVFHPPRTPSRHQLARTAGVKTWDS